jgi:hypothetical protein
LIANVVLHPLSAARCVVDFRNSITMPIGPFSATAGLEKTKIYELIADGEIKSVTIGKRRLIIVQSYLDLLERMAQNPVLLASPNPRAHSALEPDAERHDVEPPRRRGRPSTNHVARPTTPQHQIDAPRPRGRPRKSGAPPTSSQSPSARASR